MNKLVSLTFVAGVGAMSFTACGGSDSGGSTEGFCDSLANIEESDINPDDDFDGAMQALEDVRSNAPGDLKGELDTFIEVMNNINDAGEEADFTEFEDQLADLTAAVEKIQEYADANCEDLPEDLFN